MVEKELMMIRKLIEEDRNNVLDFLSHEPSINLFIIGDVEAFGFEETFQTLWGQFSDDGQLEGVLLKFYESYIPYFTKPTFDINDFMKIILNHNGTAIISGKESLLKKFDACLPEHTRKSTYFCELTHQDQLINLENMDLVKKAEDKDAERIYKFIETIEEFNSASNSVDRIKHTIKTGTGRIFYMENDIGEMVSVAQTSAENSQSAMIVGVATLKEYRGKGFMHMCLTKLCADVMSEGKTLCLFYDNPQAGKIYHKLGFETIDNWMMLTIGES